MPKRVQIWLDDEMARRLFERFPGRQERGAFVRGAVHRALEDGRPVARRKNVPGRLPASAAALLSRIEAGDEIDEAAHRKDLRLLERLKRVVRISGRIFPI